MVKKKTKKKTVRKTASKTTKKATKKSTKKTTKKTTKTSTKKSTKKTTLKAPAIKYVEYHKKKIDPSRFIDREMSWLEFNRRVLHEAIDKRTPLFERLKFCEIFISNLDEYTMKRMGALKNIKASKIHYSSMDGKSIYDKYAEIQNEITTQLKTLKKTFEKDLAIELRQNDIHLIEWKNLNAPERQYLTKYFKDNIYPVLTPLAVDIGHPFPFISNLSKSLGISFKRPKDKRISFARVKIPQNIPQWVKSTERKTKKFRFVNLEEIISNNLGSLFKGMKIEDVTLFRIARNADYDTHEEDYDDLMEIMEESLKERKFAPCVRLEHAPNPNEWLMDFIKTELDMNDEDCIELTSRPQYTSFSEITSLPMPDLKQYRQRPIMPRELKKVFHEDISFFHALRQRDILVHHPYESFDKSVTEFIKQAADDKKVMAIKMTLYRTDSAGKIIEHLIRAAENGKQVVVVIELKARFDEQSNIKWANKLEDLGIHVTYGFLKKKTHSKLSLIIRKDDDKIRAYSHIGTGNYNPQTSKIYEDFSLFTSNKDLTSEVIEVFNYLTGQSKTKNYKHLLIAPFNMKSRFLELIDNEIKNKKRKRPARILAKMNQIEDTDIINKLYEASQAGVPITLFIRGFCCLRPGVKGLSENIEVRSIIGKYLEHSRIFHFANGRRNMEDGKFYMGSADWMYRNLVNRVEAATPILDKKHCKRMSEFFKMLMDEKRQTWISDGGGKYKQLKSNDIGLHEKLEHYFR